MKTVNRFLVLFFCLVAMSGCEKMKSVFKKKEVAVPPKVETIQASKAVLATGIPVAEVVPTPEVNKTCSGKFIYGACWHIAEPFESCEKYCAKKGGCQEQPTVTLIKQNHCVNVARAFFNEKTTQATCLGVEVSGCTVVKESFAVATSAKPYDAACAATLPTEFKTRCSWSARRVCACAK